ncbi:hypothetical protein ACXNSR_35180 [Streptomyces sp. NC-S4]
MSGLRQRMRASASANAERHAGGLGAGVPREIGAADRPAAIVVPTPVLDGVLDSGDISAHARAIADAVPGADRRRFAPAAHMINLESSTPQAHRQTASTESAGV